MIISIDDDFRSDDKNSAQTMEELMDGLWNVWMLIFES